MSADRIAASADQPETAFHNGSRNCSMTLLFFITGMSCFLPYAPPEQDRRHGRGMRIRFVAGKREPGGMLPHLHEYRMSQCLPASESRFGYAASEAKARGSRLSGQRIARAFHRINFIMISEKWGRPCRYHVEEGLQECLHPSAYRGCSPSFLRGTVHILKSGRQSVRHPGLQSVRT